MDTDILKPDTGYLSIIERPSQLSSSKGSSDQRGVSPSSSLPHSKYTEPVSEGEEDENLDVAPARDEDKRTGLSGAEVAAAIAYREQMLKERRATEAAMGKRPAVPRGHGDEEAIDSDADEDEGDDSDERTAFLRGRKNQVASLASRPNGANRHLSIDPLAPSSAFDETLRSRLREERKSGDHSDDDEDEDEQEGHADDEYESGGPAARLDDRVLSRDWSAPLGKRIAVPVRIEPKVYFAAERTFLVSRPVFYFISTPSHHMNRNGLTSPSSSGPSPRLC